MKIGFIGAGNMAQAIFRGWLGKGVAQPEQIAASDVLPSLLTDLSEELNIRTYETNQELVESSELVVLAVKPIFAEAVLREIAHSLGSRSLVSIVSGFTVAKLQSLLPKSACFLRIMPNTPAMVGEGTTLFCEQNTLSPETLVYAQHLFEANGSVHILEERLFDAATSISGCGPAFLYVLQEAMADAGVANGLPRALAYKLAAQTVLGAGKMLLFSGQHPGTLKDAVCSPGGTTIRGVEALERAGGRSAIWQAVQASFDATVQQSK